MSFDRLLKMAMFAMTAAACLVVFRVALLQFMPWASDDNPSLTVQMQRRQDLTVHRRPMLARDNTVIAESVTTRHLFVDPEFLFYQFLSHHKVDMKENYQAQWNEHHPAYLKELNKIAYMLEQNYALDTEESLKKLQKKNSQGQLRRFVILKKDLTVDEELKLKEHRKKMRENKDKVANKLYKAFNHIAGQKRVYPFGVSMSHISGMVMKSEVKGIDALELYYDKRLRGEPGKLLVEYTAGRKMMTPPKLVELPSYGQDLRLTVDVEIQNIVEAAMKKGVEKWEPKNACIIVMNPHNGEILALSVRPNYDPNNIRQDDVSEGRVVNMALSKRYEPGSILKPLIWAAAYENGAFKLGEMIDCENGAWKIHGRTLRDFHSYQYLSVEDVLVKSSNIGMAKLAGRMIEKSPQKYPGRALYSWLEKMELRERTGVDMPGEINGFYYPLHKWGKTSWASIPMGHEIAITPLQYVRALSSLANGGYLVHPHIAAGRYKKPKRIFKRETTKVVSQIMKETVERGTCQRAQVDGVDVCAKTGTAEKVINGRYDRTKNVASMAAFAPMDSAKITVLVMFDEPTREHGRPTGGVVCGPIMQEILKNTLNYLDVKPLSKVKPNLNILGKVGGE